MFNKCLCSPDQYGVKDNFTMTNTRFLSGNIDCYSLFIFWNYLINFFSAFNTLENGCQENSYPF